MASPNEVWEAIFTALERLRSQWPAPDWMYGDEIQRIGAGKRDELALLLLLAHRAQPADGVG